MTVVVGVDGLPYSLAAIRLAMAEATYRAADLVAVMGYTDNTALGAPAARPLSAPRPLAAERQLAESALRAAVTQAVGNQEQERVQLRAVVGLTGHALVETAHEVKAQLVVLAARKERSPSRLLGAVNQYVLRNAPCPVLVVPASPDPI
jgi:nucleotide-binding universal stress UspA family protein